MAADLAQDIDQLAAAATLLGRLLLVEIDQPLLERLRQPDVTRALSELGVTLGDRAPEVTDDEALRDQLAAEFYRLLLRPEEGAPLVQSLHQEGRYEGDAAVAVRRLADEAGLEHDQQPARGAPRDHIGALLLLWAELACGERAWPAGADHLRQHHLGWAARPLRRLSEQEGEFYPRVAAASAQLIEALPALS